MIDLRMGSCVPQEEMLRHVEHAHSLGLSVLEERSGRPPLAVLGGGHSAEEFVDEVRDFDGEVWIAGSAFRWWIEQGVEGKFFSIHPSDKALANLFEVKDAVLATVTHPSVLAALCGARIELFDIENCATTSVTAVPYLAVKYGYESLTFYGFDSSYADKTHVYMDTGDPWKVYVDCGGREYLTGAEFLKQAEFLTMCVNAAPNFFINKSRGLLAAMIEAKGLYEVKSATQEFWSVVQKETA